MLSQVHRVMAHICCWGDFLLPALKHCIAGCQPPAAGRLDKTEGWTHLRASDPLILEPGLSMCLSNVLPLLGPCMNQLYKHEKGQ